MLQKRRRVLQYRRNETSFSHLKKPISVSFFISSLYFLLLFIIYGVIILPLFALRKTQEIIETKLAPGRPLHANLHAKIAGRSTARRRAAVNHKDSRLFPLERGPHFFSFSLSLAVETKNRGQVPHVKSARVPDFTAALRLLSKTDRPRWSILSLLRRFYAPLMEPKLRTIGRSTAPSGQLTVSKASNASRGRSGFLSISHCGCFAHGRSMSLSHFSDFEADFRLFQQVHNWEIGNSSSYHSKSHELR